MSSKTEIRPPGPGKEAWLWMTHTAHMRALNAAGANGLAIYCGLCSLAPKGGGAFHASAQNIARAASLAVRTVQRTLPLLANARLITIESGVRPGGNVANRIALLTVHPSFVEGRPITADSHEVTTDSHNLLTPDSHNVTPMKPASLARNRKLSVQTGQRGVSQTGAHAPALPFEGQAGDAPVEEAHEQSEQQQPPKRRSGYDTDGF